MINAQVIDLISETRRNIACENPQSLDAVRTAPLLAAFSTAMHAQQRALKIFLRDNLYRHYQVLRMTNKARRIIGDLFGAFIESPDLLPPQYQAMARENCHRAVADYIAGMTDRYAIREHRRLFAVGEI
jgi:dGTPase